MSKARVPGLPGDGNCVIVRSLVLSQYQHVTDGQTDRQTDTSPMAISRSSVAEHDKNVVIILKFIYRPNILLRPVQLFLRNDTML